MNGEKLKAPFPAFGGKSRVAGLVWPRLGDVRNYVEPFCFSAAMLLLRPHESPQIETINDLNAYVANFWRAMQADPGAVAHYADWPVNETDLHARHAWLARSERSLAALEHVKADPEYFDPKIAGWWCWGACMWIGSGWCDDQHRNSLIDQRMHITSDGRGNGVNRGPREQLPDLSGESGATGRGVLSNAGPKRPALCNGSTTFGQGVHKRPVTERTNGKGIHTGDASRPQLADQHSRGRGVHGNNGATDCERRTAWLLNWFERLANRLRPVRVCCGHWQRVCDSPSTLDRLGLTAVFLDPPYRKKLASGKKNRSSHIYANDRSQDVGKLCDEVQAWCLKWGNNPQIRIALCGLEGEYPAIEAARWECVAWKSNGGYGNRRKENKNAERERIWFSPHCLKVTNPQRTLFVD